MDRLGKIIDRDLYLSTTMPLFSLWRQHRGTSNLQSRLHRLPHPARHLLQHLATHGAPVVLTTPPWTATQIDAAVHRGPHKSAHDYVEFLRDELADMVDRSTWMVLPYHCVRGLPNLRISPMGVVPQHERRPRPIVDYSFSFVNHDTAQLSPPEAMQFGRALERLIAHIVHSDPRFGPVHFIKIDIADGFYRVWLRLEDIPKLAVTIPNLPGEPPLVALPLALPMGWTQSPPYFCAVTETIADLANLRLHKRRRPPPHRLEGLANTPTPTPDEPSPPSIHAPCTPFPPANPLVYKHRRMLATCDVFVDDFIGAAQGSHQRLTTVRRNLLAAIDDVFRPLMPDDPPTRTEPISTKKLLQGDAAWETRKKILGWILDSVAMTITLPPRRLQRLTTLLDAIPPTRKRLALRSYHQLLGELRSMALALPGARGLFSHLQAALATATSNRLRLHSGFHRALQDFRWMRDDVSQRPTRLQELVPTTPSLIGTHDAAGPGAGGVWFPHPSVTTRQARLLLLHPDGHLHRVSPRRPGPVVWRMPFALPVQTQLVSADNPTGKINNSQLELVGAFLQDEVAAHCFAVRERTIKSSTDNLNTLYWHRRGSVTTTSPTATLLRHQAIHQRFHRYLPLRDYIPGLDNRMADDASRLFHLSNAEFLAYFNQAYPQITPWALYTIHPSMRSTVTSALLPSRSPPASFLRDPAKLHTTGMRGSLFAPRYPWILPWTRSVTASPTCKSSPTDSDTATSTPAAELCAARPWRMPYATLGKRSRLWGPPTHA